MRHVNTTTTRTERAVDSSESNEPFIPLDDAADVSPRPSSAPWTIIVADDDDTVHAISRMVLRDFSFEGRPVRLLSARSAAATRQLLAENPDAAILLLDVVMETDTAGLDVVRHVRDELRNTFIRIILRTGQPGQAPESWVVVNYDINDYREKTELTAQKLVTTVVSALRAFRDMRTIDRNRRGLEHIIEAARTLFEIRSLARFSKAVLQQLTALMHLGPDSVLAARAAGFVAAREGEPGSDAFRILAGTGVYEQAVGRPMAEAMPDALGSMILEAGKQGGTRIEANEFIGHFRSSTRAESLVFLHTPRVLDDVDVGMLRLFASNVGVAFDSVCLHEELGSTQKELLNVLSEVIETSAQDAGPYPLRGGLIGSRDAGMLRLAVPIPELGEFDPSEGPLTGSGTADAPGKS